MTGNIGILTLSIGEAITRQRSGQPSYHNKQHGQHNGMFLRKFSAPSPMLCSMLHAQHVAWT